MSDSQIVECVLELLRASHKAIPARDLFDALSRRAISGSQVRRALLQMADARQIQITSDRKVAVPA